MSTERGDLALPSYRYLPHPFLLSEDGVLWKEVKNGLSKDHMQAKNSSCKGYRKGLKGKYRVVAWVSCLMLTVSRQLDLVCMFFFWLQVNHVRTVLYPYLYVSSVEQLEAVLTKEEVKERERERGRVK